MMRMVERKNFQLNGFAGTGKSKFRHAIIPAKEGKPEVFSQIKYALHLPQYLSYLISSMLFPTLQVLGVILISGTLMKIVIMNGCTRKELLKNFASVVPSDYVLPVEFEGNKFQLGIGLHDSSAALNSLSGKFS